jgi:hypothetical protein
VLPWETRRTRRNGRGGAGRRPGWAVLESLEERQLLAYTPLGYSLPDLTVSGYNASIASWGGPLTVTVNVQNLGASTLIEPTALVQAAPSRADSDPTTVSVLVSRNPNKGGVFVGSIAVPTVKQNNLVQLTDTLALPNQPSGFPGNGGKVFIRFVVNPGGVSPESDSTNNRGTGSAVKIKASTPDVIVQGLDVPGVMQPGDTIQPNIGIANFGTADTGPVTVELVASLSKTLDEGSSIVATYNLANIPGVSQSSKGNIAQITGAPVTLPTSPGKYFLGVFVVGQSGNKLSQVRTVGPRIKGLPGAGVLFTGAGAGNLPFPFPPNVTPSGISTTIPQTGINTG